MTDGRTHWDECWRQHHDCAVAEVERLRRIEKLALIWSAYQDDESKANPDLLMQSLDAADALYDAVSARLPDPTTAP